MDTVKEALKTVIFITASFWKPYPFAVILLSEQQTQLGIYDALRAAQERGRN